MSENRNIGDILKFRSDISPFLVHLTKTQNNIKACDALKTLIKEKSLKCSKPISNAFWRLEKFHQLSNEDKLKYFSAICFTETPLNEIHCLFDISYRQVKLDSYGLVFLKERLKNRGVSPVLYINNEKGDKDVAIQSLCSLIESYPNESAQILPLIDIFGKMLTPAWSNKEILDQKEKQKRIDFLWEREWRWPYIEGIFSFTPDDIFVGLCPD